MVLGYVVMVAGGIFLVAYLSITIVDYAYHKLQAEKAFFEFLYARNKERKKNEATRPS